MKREPCTIDRIPKRSAADLGGGGGPGLGAGPRVPPGRNGIRGPRASRETRLPRDQPKTSMPLVHHVSLGVTSQEGSHPRSARRQLGAPTPVLKNPQPERVLDPPRLVAAHVPREGGVAGDMTCYPTLSQDGLSPTGSPSTLSVDPEP